MLCLFTDWLKLLKFPVAWDLSGYKKGLLDIDVVTGGGNQPG